MLNINHYISLPLINVRIKANSKKRVIEELVGLFLVNKDINKKYAPVVCKAILKRETLGSTGIGQGIALPHVKLKKIKKIKLAFANSEEGIEFNSLDGEPVHIVFLLIGPEKAGHEYTEILALLAQYLNDPYFRRDLTDASKKKDVIASIRKKEK